LSQRKLIDSGTQVIHKRRNNISHRFEKDSGSFMLGPKQNANATQTALADFVPRAENLLEPERLGEVGGPSAPGRREFTCR
jgi:hypothetical protein